MSDFWQKTISSAQAIRRELHQYPELGWQENRTAERIRAELTQLGIPWTVCAQTGTVAKLTPRNITNSNNSSHPRIALRGDIDADHVVRITIEDRSSTQSQVGNDVDLMQFAGAAAHLDTSANEAVDRIRRLRDDWE